MSIINWDTVCLVYVLFVHECGTGKMGQIGWWVVVLGVGGCPVQNLVRCGVGAWGVSSATIGCLSVVFRYTTEIQ